MRINYLSSLLANVMVILVMVLINLSLLSMAEASDESCITCHLHSKLTEDFSAPLHDVKTLAGFHGQVFKRQESKWQGSGAACQACHESGQASGKLPSSTVCLGCHTRGKSGQGDPEAVFHAEEKHWPMDEVSCISCHQGHVAGNRIIKFISSDAVDTCQQCHRKTFGSITGEEKVVDSQKPTSDKRYGQN